MPITKLAADLLEKQAFTPSAWDAATSTLRQLRKVRRVVRISKRLFDAVNIERPLRKQRRARKAARILKTFKG